MDRQIHEFIDSIAEFMVMNDKRPFAGLKEFAENTTVKELGSKDYKTGEAMRYSLALMRSLNEKDHAIHRKQNVACFKVY